jgi:hypothetical protein
MGEEVRGIEKRQKVERNKGYKNAVRQDTIERGKKTRKTTKGCHFVLLLRMDQFELLDVACDRIDSNN